jgi:hypothetical protein
MNHLHQKISGTLTDADKGGGNPNARDYEGIQPANMHLKQIH